MWTPTSLLPHLSPHSASTAVMWINIQNRYYKCVSIRFYYIHCLSWRYFASLILLARLYLPLAPALYLPSFVRNPLRLDTSTPLSITFIVILNLVSTLRSLKRLAGTTFSEILCSSAYLTFSVIPFLAQSSPSAARSLSYRTNFSIYHATFLPSFTLSNSLHQTLAFFCPHSTGISHGTFLSSKKNMNATNVLKSTTPINTFEDSGSFIPSSEGFPASGEFVEAPADLVPHKPFDAATFDTIPAGSSSPKLPFSQSPPPLSHTLSLQTVSPHASWRLWDRRLSAILRRLEKSAYYVWGATLILISNSSYSHLFFACWYSVKLRLSFVFTGFLNWYLLYVSQGLH